jgi:hypothetical protein
MIIKDYFPEYEEKIKKFKKSIIILEKKKNVAAKKQTDIYFRIF